MTCVVDCVSSVSELLAVSWVTAIHLSPTCTQTYAPPAPTMSAAYSLLNIVGFSTHAPALKRP